MTENHQPETGADVIPISRVIPRSTRRVELPWGAAVPVSLNDKRPSVWYDVAVCHHWDGSIQTWVKAVGLDDPHDRAKIARALRQAADGLDPHEPSQ